jgi:hypothetical protein
LIYGPFHGPTADYLWDLIRSHIAAQRKQRVIPFQGYDANITLVWVMQHLGLIALSGLIAVGPFQGLHNPFRVIQHFAHSSFV